MWPLADPTNTIAITQGIDAFCDDTSLMDANNNNHTRTTLELVQTTQQHLTLWNGLLEASGGGHSTLPSARGLTSSGTRKTTFYNFNPVAIRKSATAYRSQDSAVIQIRSPNFNLTHRIGT